MSRALKLFYPLVSPYVLGAPEPLIDQALLSAAGDFCRATQVVQEVSTQNVVKDQMDYDLDVPNGYQLSSIVSVWLGNDELAPAGISEVHAGTAVRGSFGTYSAASGTPSNFYQKTPTIPVVSLYPVPSASITDALAVRAAFEPSGTATTLADVLYDTYSYEVMYGAVAYLSGLPGQTFSNVEVNKRFARMFDDAILKVRTTAKFGQMRRSARVRARRFA